METYNFMYYKRHKIKYRGQNKTMEQHLIVGKYFSISPATVDLLGINFPQIIFFVGIVQR